MPTYQYSCTACGEPLEVVQSFTDDALTECPVCGGKLRKLYNAVGIVFRGAASTDGQPGREDGHRARIQRVRREGRQRLRRQRVDREVDPRPGRLDAEQHAHQRLAVGRQVVASLS